MALCKHPRVLSELSRFQDEGIMIELVFKKRGGVSILFFPKPFDTPQLTLDLRGINKLLILVSDHILSI